MLGTYGLLGMKVDALDTPAVRRGGLLQHRLVHARPDLKILHEDQNSRS